MNLTFDRRYDKWEHHRRTRERCEKCMFDAPYGEECCKRNCGSFSKCKTCTAKCKTGDKLCEK